ncbi:unnamed protein product [Phaedon cochleariae]|uniref:Uncharacterized protein n=1 Tax=Phaedon cochleariae TaxID=80249 RepID=A0A9N9SJM3_PHACE|nr:unnamed protein product [Phaedon cochleariae]
MIEHKTEANTSIMGWKSDQRYLTALFCWTIGLVSIFPVPRLFLRGNLLDTLISYMIIMIIIGIPLVLLELSISQYSRKSISGSWDLCPFFRGIGYTKVVTLFIFQIYSNVLNSYSLFYCFTSIPKLEGGNVSRDYINQSNEETFWHNEVLGMDRILDNKIGEPNWKLVGCLCANMMLVFLANHRATATVQNFLPIAFAIYCTETALLLIFILVTPGSLNGLYDFISAEVNFDMFVVWKKDAKILDVFQSVLFSLGIGLGGLSSIGAQTNFRYPVHASTLWVCLINLGAAILYALMMACLYGIIGENTTSDIEKIQEEVLHAKPDISHLFTIVPRALEFLPGFQNFWKFIFYSSMFLKGITCSVVMASTILHEIYELKPQLTRRTILCSIIFNLFTCLSGWIFLTNAGATLENFFNKITYMVLIPLINCFQITSIIIFYGLFHFRDDFNFMLGFPLPSYYQITLVSSSLLLPVFTITSMVRYFQEPLGSQANLIITLQKSYLTIVLVWIPFMALVRIIRKRDIRKIFLPSRSWGPSEDLKKSRELFDDQYSVPEFIYEKYLLTNKLEKYD